VNAPLIGCHRQNWRFECTCDFGYQKVTKAEHNIKTPNLPGLEMTANFQPAQAGDNTNSSSGAMDFTPATDNVMSNIGPDYLREAKALSTPVSNTTAGSDQQTTLNNGIDATPGLFPAPLRGGDAIPAVATTNTEAAPESAEAASAAAPESAEAASAATPEVVPEQPRAESLSASETNNNQVENAENAEVASRSRAEHRSDVVHPRPEMAMARSSGGG
jgi:hypothetical protein